MLKVHSKVVKLIRALKQYDKIYIVCKVQYYNVKMSKVLSIMKLRQIIPVAEYRKKINPNYKGKKDFIDEEIMTSFKEIDILLYLIEIYKEVQTDASVNKPT